MESIGRYNCKIQSSCKTCVFQAGLDLGTQIIDIGIYVSLSLYCLLLFNFILQNVSLHMADKMATSSSKLSSSQTSNHRAHRPSLYQCLLTPGKAVIIPSWIIWSNYSGWKSEVFSSSWVINPIHLETHWWTLPPGLNGGGEEFLNRSKKWERMPLNNKKI